MKLAVALRAANIIGDLLLKLMKPDMPSASARSVVESNHDTALLAWVFWKCYKSIINLEDRTMAKSVIIYTQPG